MEDFEIEDVVESLAVLELGADPVVLMSVE